MKKVTGTLYPPETAGYFLCIYPGICAHIIFLPAPFHLGIAI